MPNGEDDVTTVDTQVPVLELRNVNLTDGSIVALDDVSFKACVDEVIGLVGDNGAGESSLIKTVSGVNSPSSGQILVGGVERHWRSPHGSMAAGIETLYEDSGLAPDLSIDSKVFLGRETRWRSRLGRLGSLDQRAMERDALAQLTRVGISILETNRMVAGRSGAQRQAVAISQAIAWARHVIILDEPTNQLGVRQSGGVLKVVSLAREQRLCMVSISHIRPHVLEVCDCIVVLGLGRVVCDALKGEFTVESLIGAIIGLNE